MRARTLKVAQFVFACLAFVYCIIFVAPAMTTSSYEHSKFRSNPPGTLLSDRWNRDYWFTLTLSLFFYLPFGMLITIIYSKARGVHYTHVSLMFVLIVHQVLGMGFWAYDYHYGNQIVPGNGRNIFNSVDYCCVEDVIALPNNGCFQVGPCVPSVTKDQLQIDPAALWKFWAACVLPIVFCITHVIVYFCAYVGDVVSSAKDEDEEEEEVDIDYENPPLLPPAQQREKPTAPPQTSSMSRSVYHYKGKA